MRTAHIQFHSSKHAGSLHFDQLALLCGGKSYLQDELSLSRCYSNKKVQEEGKTSKSKRILTLVRWLQDDFPGFPNSALVQLFKVLHWGTRQGETGSTLSRKAAKSAWKTFQPEQLTTLPLALTPTVQSKYRMVHPSPQGQSFCGTTEAGARKRSNIYNMFLCAVEIGGKTELLLQGKCQSKSILLSKSPQSSTIFKGRL